MSGTDWALSKVNTAIQNKYANKVAPIALFVYNRPWHTRQTVEALQKNEFSSESDLFIFSDAARKPEAVDAVCKVREYIKTIGGFKSVNIVEREENLGLANSIIGGVSRLCEEYGRVIVLEDDLVVSPMFLAYMRTALNKYNDEPRVMQISGNMFPVLHPEALPRTFFCRVTTSWGWATWDRAWRKFEPDAKKLANMITTQKLRKDFDSGYDYFQMLTMQGRGEIDSWAIRWYASVFLSGGFCLHPSLSLVSNIGHDGSGVHCVGSSKYSVSLSSTMPEPFPQIIEESPQGQQALENFFQSTCQSPWRRLLGRVKNVLRYLVKLP
jgi:Glycosyl transferase family 2